MLGCSLLAIINDMTLMNLSNYKIVFYHPENQLTILFLLLYLAIIGLFCINIKIIAKTKSIKRKNHHRIMLCILIFYIIAFFPYQLIFSYELINIKIVVWFIIDLIGFFFFYIFYLNYMNSPKE